MKKLLLVFAAIFLLVFSLNAWSASAPTAATPVPLFFWQGYGWLPQTANGMTVSILSGNILDVNGFATSSFWDSYGSITKRFSKTYTQVEISLGNLPASASSGGIWLVKDNQNALIVEKHRDVTTPQYNTNLFIVERINGVDFFRYVSPDLPSSAYNTYRIQKIPNGYEVYYDNTLAYTGNLDLNSHKIVKIAGYARAAGDQLSARFRNYIEN